MVDLVTRDELRARLDRVQIFDARSAAEHDGSDLRRNLRGGHLPGAVSLPHTQLLASDGQLHKGPMLLDKLASAGLDRSAPVVTHCDAGGRAALAALAAVQAGYRDVSAYYLSFSDWAADERCPVVQA